MTQQATMSGTAWAMMLVLAAVWGGSFFFVEVALTEEKPLTIVLHRVFWALPVLGAVLWWKGLVPPRDPGIWGAYLVMGALNNVIPFGLIVWGQTHLEGGLASIINGMTAMFGAVVAGALLADERLTFGKIMGAVLGLIGVAVIIGPDAVAGLDIRDLAQVAILGATLSYAFASVWGKVALRGIAPEINAFGMLAGSTILMVPLVLAVDGVPSFDYSPGVWASLLGIAWLATALAYLLYFGILVRAGAANLMLVTLLVPPFAVALGAAFLDERLSPMAFAGFALIAVGLAVTDGRLFKRSDRA